MPKDEAQLCAANELLVHRGHFFYISFMLYSYSYLNMCAPFFLLMFLKKVHSIIKECHCAAIKFVAKSMYCYILGPAASG